MGTKELVKTPFRIKKKTHLRGDAELRRQVEQRRGNSLDHLHHQVFAAVKKPNVILFTRLWFGNRWAWPTCGADGSLGGLMPVRC